MNAGPDVERSIAQWLVEELPGRAPDRILANAAHVIDRTKQRRFAVAWREPVTLSIRTLAAVAAIVIVAIVGAGWVGRSTAAIGGQATPAPTGVTSPSPAAVTLTAYRAARDALCTAAWPQRQALDARIGDGLTDPATKPADRAAKLVALQEEMAFERGLYNQLLGLDAPAELESDLAAWSANVDGIFAIVVDQEIPLIQDGKYSEAAAVDLTTNPLARASEAFETKYQLKPCP
jgi:hypothetical protein